MNEEEEFEFRLRMERESQQPTQEQEDPSYLAVAGNAIAKGAASFGDMFLNAPVNAYNVAKAGVVAGGDALGTDLRDDLTITPQPNLIEQGMRATGLISDDRNPVTPGQRILDMALQAGVGVAISPAKGALDVARNAVVGIGSGALAGITKEMTGSSLAATAVGIATPLIARGAPSKANAPILRNPVKLKSAQDGMAAGLVIPPSYIKPSFPISRLEGAAGKAATKQAAQAQNVEVIDSLARKAIGLPEMTPIEIGIEHVRAQANKAYEAIAKLNPGGQLQGMKVKRVEKRGEDLPGPITGMKVSETRGEPLTTGLAVKEVRDADGRLTGMKVGGTSKGEESALEGMKTKVTSRGQNVPGELEGLRVKVQESRGGIPLQELRQARADATTFFNHFNVSKDPESLRKAKSLSARANGIEDEFERLAVASGQPELIQNFRQARTLIAKTYDIERALNKSDGHVEAEVLGRMFSKKHPLSGELAIIGRFASAFPDAVRKASRIQSAGVSGTEAGMSALLGITGAGAAGPIGLIAGGLPMLRGPARSLLLSKGYQNSLLDEAPGLNQAMFQSILAGRSIAETK